MAYGLSNGHVTDDVTSSPKVLWGSTVGCPSDSLASCTVWTPEYYFCHSNANLQLSSTRSCLIFPANIQLNIFGSHFG